MDGDFYIFENNRYRQGFLYKNMIMSAILSEGVKPTLSELEKFETSIDDAELECRFFLGFVTLTNKYIYLDN